MTYCRGTDVWIFEPTKFNAVSTYYRYDEEEDSLELTEIAWDEVNLKIGLGLWS